MRIAVVGAGVGGLVAATGLQRDGHDVTVYERRDAPGAVGAGLTLFGNAFDALDTVGLGGTVRAVSDDRITRMRTGQRSPSGRWLTTVPPRAVATARTVHRNDLHDALVSALRPGSLVAGTEAHPSPDGSPVLALAAREAAYDLVVVADGIRSAGRARLGLDTGLRYAGYAAWRGVTEEPVDLAGAAGETWGRGRRFGIVPLGDGRVYWFATHDEPEGTRAPDERARARALFAGWHHPVGQCIDATPHTRVLRHDVHDLRRPLRAFVRDRTVLLGDAAHAMTPDLGQGAGQAIEDAATLVVVLRDATGPDDLESGLARYDAHRRRRTRALAARSRAAGRVGQISNPLLAGSRDVALRTVAPTLLVRASRTFRSWTPPSSGRNT
ncbi:FAD-dependent monooxygenase [Sanguibacter suaedae]|uniref:FAD-dependent monooxygenase n=1 Tax=Sanguibacter suaedae TaxID=2795737 RepID=UPI0027DB9CAC|nr:FAD-dependent monooxygenase [Sanguibacter suaedae]